MYFVKRFKVFEVCHMQHGSKVLGTITFLLNVADVYKQIDKYKSNGYSK